MDTVDEDIFVGFFFSPVYLINENVFQKGFGTCQAQFCSVAPPAVVVGSEDSRPTE